MRKSTGLMEALHEAFDRMREETPSLAVDVTWTWEKLPVVGHLREHIPVSKRFIIYNPDII